MRCLAVAAVVACSSPPAPRPVIAPAVPDAMPAVPDAAVEAQRFPPGCTAAESTARLAELEAIDEALNNAGDPKQILATIRAALAKPCLVHVGSMVVFPPAPTLPQLRDAWFTIDHVLDEAAAPLLIWRDQPLLAIPPQLRPALPDAARRELAWLACPANDATCVRVESYIQRAEAAFDARLEVDEGRFHVPEHEWGGTVKHVIPTAACDGGWRKEQAPRTFEPWLACVTSRIPVNRRFAEHGFRALDRGWLVMRGRRGHYQAADEIRAYDLATGAAYVVQLQGGVIMTPDQVKLAAQGPQGFTGRLAVDHLREIAFLLLARGAVVEQRTSEFYAAVPPKLPLVLSPSSDITTFGRVTWSSSNQTHIDFAYLDGATRKTGTFVWPDAASWIDDHVDELIRIMEAGMVPGCAPAKLPPPSVLAGPPATAPIDADPNLARSHELEEALERLRSSACRGAK